MAESRPESSPKSNLSRRGGKRPGAGRKPNEYKTWLGRLLDSPEHREAFEAEIKGMGTEKGFAFATRHAAAYHHGLPAQTIQGPDGGPVQVQVINAPDLE